MQAESEALCDRNEEPPAHKPSKEEGLSALAGGSKGPVDGKSGDFCFISIPIPG